MNDRLCPDSRDPRPSAAAPRRGLVSSAARAACLIAPLGSAALGASSNCCVSHSTPGCDNAACQAAVCFADALCCNSSWDSFCAATAEILCPNVCGAGVACQESTHDCCTTGGPGCNDVVCCGEVCASDAFCCEGVWDQLCVNAALANCETGCVSACATSTHDCCTSGFPGCTDLECCDAVCAVDTFCCAAFWDANCIALSRSLCGLVCGDPCKLASHDCAVTGGPGCTDLACCEGVCRLDVLCCELGWDSSCVDTALATCDFGPFCNECCPADLNFDGVVDGADLGLLLAAWGTEDRCANLDGGGVVDGADLGLLLAAWGPCPSAIECDCAVADHDCCEIGGPGCTDLACCAAVCAVDGFCCLFGWDELCVGEAGTVCGMECQGEPRPE